MNARLFFIVLAAGCLIMPSGYASMPQNVAFYYGDEAPVATLMAYDWVVLQQDQTSAARLDVLTRANSLPLAYVSIGEMARSHQLIKSLAPAWLIGQNKAWDSHVLDLRQPAVRNFILDRLIDPAFARGFKGVFLDTMDSFGLSQAGQASPDAFAEAQHQLLRDIRSRHPDARIVLNRGFHLPESSHDLIDGLAFESYRNGYDAGRKRYRPVPEDDRRWLDQQLVHWRDVHPQLPLIAIDYIKDPSEAPRLAEQLRQDGFVPYVSDPDLKRLGPTQPTQVRRHMLVIHDLQPDEFDRSAAHRQGAVLLEHLGFVPHYRSTRQPLPEEPTSDRYAGMLVWWEGGERSTGFCSWLARQQDAGLPVIVFGQLPADPACRTVIGADEIRVPADPLTNTALQPSVGTYEGRRLPTLSSAAQPVSASANAWLTVTDSQGQQYTPIYTHPQGGTALAPYLLEPGPDDQAYWLFNPLAFIREAMGNAAFPAIDTTTESGRRILTAHIDGDGFVSRGEFPGTPLSAEVLEREILTRFPIPHTVSVIEAEVSPEGLYPALSNEAERTARSLFRLNHVEVASHSYSHPFFWQSMEGGSAPNLDQTQYGYFMNIPGYQGSLDREVEGSVRYINQNLAPADKPVSVFLWTGDARPGAEALRRVREAGLLNVNGGDTHPLPFDSELAGVWPDARPVGDELQIYAPAMNENVYTNLWQGPYYGFRDVIDTFDILEAKGRLKPIGIYYHFYSGTKPEALNALREVYRYALDQPVTPLFLSDYARRVETNYRSALLLSKDGSYRWRGIGTPHTVRINPEHQYPDLEHSRGVAGFHDAAGNRYVHLTGTSPRLKLTDQRPSGPYLSNANAPLTHWSREQRGASWHISLGFNGHQPIEFVLAGTPGCHLANAHAFKITAQADTVTITSPAHSIDSLSLECQ